MPGRISTVVFPARSSTLVMAMVRVVIVVLLVVHRHTGLGIASKNAVPQEVHDALHALHVRFFDGTEGKPRDAVRQKETRGHFDNKARI